MYSADAGFSVVQVLWVKGGKKGVPMHYSYIG